MERYRDRKQRKFRRGSRKRVLNRPRRSSIRGQQKHGRQGEVILDSHHSFHKLILIKKNCNSQGLVIITPFRNSQSSGRIGHCKFLILWRATYGRLMFYCGLLTPIDMAQRHGCSVCVLNCGWEVNFCKPK